MQQLHLGVPWKRQSNLTIVYANFCTSCWHYLAKPFGKEDFGWSAIRTEIRLFPQLLKCCRKICLYLRFVYVVIAHTSAYMKKLCFCSNSRFLVHRTFQTFLDVICAEWADPLIFYRKMYMILIEVARRNYQRCISDNVMFSNFRMACVIQHVISKYVYFLLQLNNSKHNSQKWKETLNLKTVQQTLLVAKNVDLKKHSK